MLVSSRLNSLNYEIMIIKNMNVIGQWLRLILAIGSYYSEIQSHIFNDSGYQIDVSIEVSMKFWTQK